MKQTLQQLQLKGKEKVNYKTELSLFMHNFISFPHIKHPQILRKTSSLICSAAILYC